MLCISRFVSFKPLPHRMSPKPRETVISLTDQKRFCTPLSSIYCQYRYHCHCQCRCLGMLNMPWTASPFPLHTALVRPSLLEVAMWSTPMSCLWSALCYSDNVPSDALTLTMHEARRKASEGKDAKIFYTCLLCWPTDKAWQFLPVRFCRSWCCCGGHSLTFLLV